MSSNKYSIKTISCTQAWVLWSGVESSISNITQLHPPRPEVRGQTTSHDQVGATLPQIARACWQCAQHFVHREWSDSCSIAQRKLQNNRHRHNPHRSIQIRRSNNSYLIDWTIQLHIWVRASSHHLKSYNHQIIVQERRWPLTCQLETDLTCPNSQQTI